ncbi:MAG: protoheme IX farnesyltransferase [Alphaproteobacteria bacterium]|nr:protoheme IX farnesyltransferase [Alphaproteobacteria bacterium]NCQ88650.1 protoheme IX farnesyltransferase [Alphaproteobacteria bacterium]NCT06193.1 protoheme IX farnesyltransferase [Alphaproteobacteria bacterium]
MTIAQNTAVSITQASEMNASVGDYFALLKPRVMSLVIFSGFAGLWVAPGFSDMNWFLSFVAMLCLAINAGAAGAINMWYDRDIDAIMNRTKTRPLPMGKMHPDEALSFGIVLSVLSVLTMGVALNWVAAGLLAFANLFYVVVYTMWLKRKTPQNIVIGGAAGAFPPMIGWAAVTGDITLTSIALFAIIFIWTPPHFWALSLFANEDYKRAKVPMLPVTHGEHHTKIQMIIYTIILLPLSITPYFLGTSGLLYGVAAFALSGFFLFTAIRVLKDKTLKSAKLMFGYSVFYLFAIFLALMIDQIKI